MEGGCHFSEKPRGSLLRALDVFVDQVFKVFLAAAGVLGNLPFLENVFFQILEAGASSLNLRTDPRIPGTVALVDKVFQSTICTNGSGDFEPTGKGVHPADMRMEQVDWLKTFSTYLGIEIDPTWLETTVVEDRKHALGGQIDVGGELIGVPTQHHIARIGVNATQGTSGRCDLQFMLHGVAGQGRMIGFQVELEMSHQSILPEKIQASSSIGIILVFGRFLGLGLNVELAFEADLFLVVYRHVEKCGQMIHLAFELGIPECGISFPSSPEGVPRLQGIW